MKKVIYNWLLQEKGSLIKFSLYEDPISNIYINNRQIVWNKDSQNYPIKYIVKINKGVILMSSRNENIQTKIALINEVKKLKQLTYLEYSKFEKYDSYWLQLFDSELK